jgi:hypothetical protein
MAPRCSLCDHDQREQIEAALLTESVLAIARRFEISADALQRHKQRHLSAALATVSESYTLASAKGLVEVAERQIAELEQLKLEARNKRGGGAEARRCIEAVMRSVATLADLAGLSAPKVSIQLQAQIPTSGFSNSYLR